MAEPDKQQIGDGNDNIPEAVKQASNAASQMTSGAESAKNAAAAAVEAGAESGKAAANLAAGTAAGGPWGAILSAAWSARHTLFKVVVCISLLLLFFAVIIVSLPSIVMSRIFGTDPAPDAPETPVTVQESYDEMALAVSEAIEGGYDTSLETVDSIIQNGGYDYDLSMEALVNYAQSTAGYDTSYILAAYSASLQQQGTTKDDMIAKLDAVAGEMFPVTYVEKETTRTVHETTYTETGEAVQTTKTVTVHYVECTIHPFDETVILNAFGIDPEATYDQFGVSYAEAIENMANSLKMTLYGSLGDGQMVPLTDEELLAFVSLQECTAARKHVLETALSLVGRVPYFWGGKSPPGWNDEWNTPQVVTDGGSSSTGTIRPYGLDCSGFTAWVYETALGVKIGVGTTGQYPNTEAVSASELLPGDLAFWPKSDGSGWNHVLIFAGFGENGEKMWVHCTTGSGVVLDTPSYESSLVLRRLTVVDYDVPVPEASSTDST